MVCTVTRQSTMIITINGRAGSGKSTIAKLLCKKLGFKHYSSGDFMRELAKERNMTLLELSELAERDKSIDEEIDRRQTALGKEQDDFVIDGRLSAHFIPHASKVFLDCEDETRARRILKAKRGDENNKNPDQTLENIKKREASETKRYLTYYSFNPYESSNYDLVIDTTNLTPDKIIAKIEEHIQKRR